MVRQMRGAAAPPAPHLEISGSTRTRSQALGSVGETVVAIELRRLGWPVLRNMVLSVRGHTVEVDAIVLLDDALLVLEVKTLSGVISETEDISVWERCGRTGSVRFQSPLVQNGWHIDAVRQVVDDERIVVRGAVVSAGTARFSPAIESQIVTLAELPTLLGRPSGRKRRAPLSQAWEHLQSEARLSSARRALHAATMEARVAAR